MIRLIEKREKESEAFYRQFRIDIISIPHELQTGHAGGSLSEYEILIALYVERANISKENQYDSDRDRIILSKEHGASILYRCLCEKGSFPKEEMCALRQPGSRPQGRLCSAKTPGVELSTGSLGIGLSASVGVACANQLMENDAYVLTVMDDGELNEGTVQEAAMSVVKLRRDHLTGIMDWNKVQLDGTATQVMPMDHMEEHWKSFGWDVPACDGHKIAGIYTAAEKAKSMRNGKPYVILADTIKGKGVSFMEGTNKYHGKVVSDEEYVQAMKELGSIKWWEWR